MDSSQAKNKHSTRKSNLQAESLGPIPLRPAYNSASRLSSQSMISTQAPSSSMSTPVSSQSSVPYELEHVSTPYSGPSIKKKSRWSSFLKPFTRKKENKPTKSNMSSATYAGKSSTPASTNQETSQLSAPNLSRQPTKLDPRFDCLKCSRRFSSRNSLFIHIEKMNHGMDPRTRKPEPGYKRPVNSWWNPYWRKGASSLPRHIAVPETYTSDPARKPATLGSNSQCLTCSSMFPSRNSLFIHIEARNHGMDPRTRKPEPGYKRPTKSWCNPYWRTGAQKQSRQVRDKKIAVQSPQRPSKGQPPPHTSRTRRVRAGKQSKSPAKAVKQYVPPVQYQSRRPSEARFKYHENSP
jgi:hypothetical protein